MKKGVVHFDHGLCETMGKPVDATWGINLPPQGEKVKHLLLHELDCRKSVGVAEEYLLLSEEVLEMRR